MEPYRTLEQSCSPVTAHNNLPLLHPATPRPLRHPSCGAAFDNHPNDDVRCARHKCRRNEINGAAPGTNDSKRGGPS